MDTYISKTDVHKYRFSFDGRVGFLNDFIARFGDLENGTPVEVLPSIYCQSKGSSSRIRRAMFGAEQYIITNRNKRNSFKIFKQEDYVRTTYDTTNESSESTIKLSSIEFPDELSSCPVVQFFMDNKLLGVNSSDSAIESYIEPDTSYYLFSIREILMMTATDVELKRVCRNADRCGSFFSRIEAGCFNNEKTTDPIILQQYGDTIVPYEGKHKICVLKRLEVPTIKANITTIPHKYPDQFDCLFKPHYVGLDWFDKVWKNYDYLFDSLQIDSETAHRIVEEADLNVVYTIIRPYIIRRSSDFI